jgi:hypothetical protein
MRTMKIREMINGQKRKAVIALSSGMAVFVVSLLISTVYTAMFFVAMIGFAVAMGGITFLEFGLSCPQCRGRIGYAVNYPGSPLTVSSKICFCPFCGVSLDSHLNLYKHSIFRSSNPRSGVKAYVTLDKGPDSR